MIRMLTAVFTAAALTVALVGFVPTPAVANQLLLVPSQYADLQAAIDAAQPGDTVLVDDGSYNGPFIISKPITVTSSSPDFSPLLTGPGLVVSISLGAGEASEISGFTISGGTDGAVFATGGYPIIRNNVITENQKCGSGPGIYAYFAAATITNNEISYNRVQPGCSATGGGIYLGGTPSAGQSFVADNSIQGNDTGIYLNAAGTPVIERNNIRNNSTYNNGGGITMFNFSDAVIRNNLFSGNTSTNGAGGIGATVPSSSDGPFIANNTFIENHGADASAIAIRVYGSSQGMIANNIFSSSSSAASLNCIPVYGGTPGVRSNLFDSTGSGAFAAGDCAGAESIDGNIVEDSAFDENATPYIGSSTVDGADALLAPADDIFGTARPIDGNGDGLAVADIGAIEIAESPGTPPVAHAGASQTIEAAWPTTMVTLDGTASFDSQGLSLSFQWAGSFLGSTVFGPNPSVQFAGLGTFPITLTVDNGSLHDQDSTSISIVDTTAPNASADLLDRGKVRGKQRRFEVDASCQDAFDQSPVADASIGGFSVADGELIHFTRSKRGIGASFVDGVLTVVGKTLDLLVSCEDQSGNATTATATR